MNEDDLSRRLAGLARYDLSAELAAELRRRAQSTFEARSRRRSGANRLEACFVLAFALVYAIWTAGAVAPLCKPNLERAERYSAIVRN